MIQLGLSGFYHDSAAAIVIDGKVICAIEEEKLSGEKHDSSFPFKAIQWCLEYTKITIDEIDMVCWYEDPELKFDRVKQTVGKWNGFRYPKQWKAFLKRWKSGEGNLKGLLESIGYGGIVCYTTHHNSHLAFSYYTSPFDKAIGLSVDGVGEFNTMHAVMCTPQKFYTINTLQFFKSSTLAEKFKPKPVFELANSTAFFIPTRSASLVRSVKRLSSSIRDLLISKPKTLYFLPNSIARGNPT